MRALNGAELAWSSTWARLRVTSPRSATPYVALSRLTTLTLLTFSAHSAAR